MSSPRSSQYRLLAAIVSLFVIAGGTGIGGYYLGRSHASTVAPKNAQNINLDAFWEAWKSLDENYYGDLNEQDRVNGAIRGMVEGLKDPYTTYMTPQEDKLFRSDLEGSFSGIGAELSMRNGLLTVDGVLEDTPAQRAGLRSKDAILEIDGTKTTDISFFDAVERIRGEKGSTVVLTIAHDGAESTEKISVVRDTITVKSVKTESLDNGQVAYVKVTQFGQDTANLFKDALQSAKQSGKKGMIIDLRGNPGGYLDSAADTIGMVLPQQISSDQAKLRDRVAVVERNKKGEEELFKATTEAIVPDMPIVVLVDQGSASASEIFAGAMKDYKRATVVGEKTFGKGSVQNLIKLENGGSIKITIAKWFTPLGTGIDGTGIEPDITVDLADDITPSTTDVQVQKALELLATARK